MFAAPRQSIELPDELAHRAAGVTNVLVSCDVRGDVTGKPFAIIPVWARRIAGAPFAPVGAGGALDPLYVIPAPAQAQMRVEPREVGNDL